MSASVLVLAVILIPLFLMVILLQDSLTTSSYLIIGAVAGFAAATITATLMILCSTKHKHAISNENGFKIQTSANNRSTLEINAQISANNTYVQGHELVKCNETLTSACPTDPPLNGPQPTQERKISIASDYTESHYYTEIDEYFINKRKEKQEKKLQHRYDNEAFEEDGFQENVVHLHGNPFMYDYAYGLNPHEK
ncbi:unnamed protein product [Arctia plantaginis]|uniref:Uncharacterized protein n=1 Tax=Arctia plantaginis TaxID=874455 RepID=A0A8S1A4P1_ARCPL|nr:unnamed protein product [Arctia plantaginis]